MFAGQLMNWSMRTTSNTLTQLKAGIGSQLKLNHELFSGFLLKINIRHSPTNRKSESGPNMVTDEQFLEAWERSGHSPNKTAKLLRVNERTVYRRRDIIERRMGQPVRSDKKPWRLSLYSSPCHGYNGSLCHHKNLFNIERH